MAVPGNHATGDRRKENGASEKCGKKCNHSRWQTEENMWKPRENYNRMNRFQARENMEPVIARENVHLVTRAGKNMRKRLQVRGGPLDFWEGFVILKKKYPARKLVPKTSSYTRPLPKNIQRTFNEPKKGMPHGEKLSCILTNMSAREKNGTWKG